MLAAPSSLPHASPPPVGYVPVHRLDNETAGARPEVSRIHWDVALPDGDRLTDPQWAPLLEAFKRFAWSLFADESRYYGRPLKPANASVLSTGIGCLARLMVRSFTRMRVANPNRPAGWRRSSISTALSESHGKSPARYEKCDTRAR